MILSSVSPELPSAGWFAYITFTYSCSLPASEAQPAAAAARVEYCVVDELSRNPSGWYTSLTLPSLTSWFIASPELSSNSLQCGQMKSRYTSTVFAPLPTTRPSSPDDECA